MRDPSGDQSGERSPCVGLMVTLTSLLPSAFITQISLSGMSPGPVDGRLGRENAIREPSGDHDGSCAGPSALVVSCVGVPPVESMTYISEMVSATLSRLNAIFVPSGDHAGSHSP